MNVIELNIDGSRLSPARAMTGLSLSKTNLLQTTIATGSITVGGTEYALPGQRQKTWTPDPTLSMACMTYLVHNPTTGEVDVWTDSYLLDGAHERADPPAGWLIIDKLLWFPLPANETDLDNLDRVYLRRIV